MKITQHVGKYFGTGDRLLKSRFSNWTMIALLAFYGCAVENESIPSRQSAASQTHETSKQAFYFTNSGSGSTPTSAETPADVYVDFDGKKVRILNGPPKGPDGKPLVYPSDWKFGFVGELTPEQIKTATEVHRTTQGGDHYLKGAKLVAIRIPQPATIDAKGISVPSGADGVQLMYELTAETTLYQRGSIWQRIGAFFGSPNQSGDDHETYKKNNGWLDYWGAVKAGYETFVKVPKDSGLIVAASKFAPVGNAAMVRDDGSIIAAETLHPTGNQVQAEIFSGLPSGSAVKGDGTVVRGYEFQQVFGGPTVADALKAAGVTITTNELSQNTRGPEASPPKYDPSVRDFSQKVHTGESITLVPQSSSAPSDASPVVPRGTAAPADVPTGVRPPPETHTDHQRGHSPSTPVANFAAVATIFGGYVSSLLAGFGFSKETADKADFAAQIAGFGADVATAGGVAAGVGTAVVSVTAIGGGWWGSQLANSLADALGVTSENLREVIQFSGATLGASGGAGLGATIAHGLNLIAATSLGAAFAGAALPVIAMGATGTTFHAGGKAVSENFIVPFIPVGDAHLKDYFGKGFAAGTPPTKCYCLTQDCTTTWWGRECENGKPTEVIVPDEASCNQQNNRSFQSTIGGVNKHTVRLRCTTNSPSPSGSQAPMQNSGGRN